MSFKFFTYFLEKSICEISLGGRSHYLLIVKCCLTLFVVLFRNTAYRKTGAQDPERTQDPGPYEDEGSYEDPGPYEDPGLYEDPGPYEDPGLNEDPEF